MTAPRTDGMYLGFSLVGASPPRTEWKAARDRGDDAYTGRHLEEVVRVAERTGVDFMVIPDALPDHPESATLRTNLDALLAASRVAPKTRTIGLVPEITTTHTEPFHVAKNLATLDFVSRGRAGWKVGVSRTQFTADLFGRKDAAPIDELFGEASEFVDVVRRLWDSWEDDAVIRDAATGRYVDRAKLHYVDYAGRNFSVRGPSITPRSPQAHPVVMVDATEPTAFALATTLADVIVVDVSDERLATGSRDWLRTGIGAEDRESDPVIVLATAAASDPAPVVADRLESWWRRGAVDGFVLGGARPAALDLLGHIVRELRDRGAFPTEPAGETFRARLGLDRPVNRYASTP